MKRKNKAGRINWRGENEDEKKGGKYDIPLLRKQNVLYSKEDYFPWAKENGKPIFQENDLVPPKYSLNVLCLWASYLALTCGLYAIFVALLGALLFIHVMWVFYFSLGFYWDSLTCHLNCVFFFLQDFLLITTFLMEALVCAVEFVLYLYLYPLFLQQEAVERLTSMNHPEGDCPLCLYPLVPEDRHSESEPFMKLMSCFHCFHW